MGDTITRKTYDEIHRLRKERKSFKDIGIELGIHSTTASSWFNKPYTAASKTAAEQIDQTVFNLLSKSKRQWTVAEISGKIDRGMEQVRTAIATLKGQGKNIGQVEDKIELHTSIVPSEPLIIDINKFKGKRVRFGATADNHLGSKYARNDVLNALYDIWQDQGITEVYQCGNMIDGDARFNKFDLLVHGMEAQANYFAEHWPQRPGMNTYFITGDDHEGWYVQREGVVIGEYLEMVARKYHREDLHYLGHMEHDLIFKAPKGKSTMRLIHAGGGTAYAISYKPQSIINSYQGGEKPNVLLIGHYHKADFNYWREVLNVQLGCTEDQSPFMRKLNIQAHVGGWTIEFEIDDNGVLHDFTTRWHPFYDRKFYENKTWGYAWDKNKKVTSSKR